MLPGRGRDPWTGSWLVLDRVARRLPSFSGFAGSRSTFTFLGGVGSGPERPQSSRFSHGGAGHCAVLGCLLMVVGDAVGSE